MMSRVFLSPLLVLAGCALGPSLQSRMAAYTGATSAALVRGMGVPDKQIILNGVQYLAYDRHRTVVTPGFINGGFGGPFFGDPFLATPPVVADFFCETTFMLQDDRVVSFTLRGNDCNY